MIKRISDFKKRTSLLFVFVCTLFHICIGQISTAPMSKTGSIAKDLSNGVDTLHKITIAGRTRKSIMDIVNNNYFQLKAIYYERLNKIPTIEGKLKLKFAINELGKVIYCQVEESNLQDTILESKIKENIMNWSFAKIDSPRDITEVIYPFVFKRNNSAVILCAILLFSILAIPLIIISH
jgi:hypothetical protein